MPLIWPRLRIVASIASVAIASIVRADTAPWVEWHNWPTEGVLGQTVDGQRYVGNLNPYPINVTVTITHGNVSRVATATIPAFKSVSPAFKFRLQPGGLFSCRTWSPGHYAESTKTILILGQDCQ